MKIFLDDDFKCYVFGAGNMREFDVPYFDGKCEAFIEGYRYIPQGETWVNPFSGVIFRGEMVSPWKDSQELDRIQRAYEAGQSTGGDASALIMAAAEAYQEGVNSAYD